MKTLRIVELIKSDAVDCDVTVKGWVRTKRGNKNVAFIALNDGSCVASIQVVVELAKFDGTLRLSRTPVVVPLPITLQFS